MLLKSNQSTNVFIAVVMYPVFQKVGSNAYTLRIHIFQSILPLRRNVVHEQKISCHIYLDMDVFKRTYSIFMGLTFN